ncbi:unnamed protein product [Mytilus coruscus]|uniref:Uncharacterized protein n=1 Tax=Mytilus coruscus TaxID=42192 RepID=A0A6J8BFF7_MYTCO|nr:unnamed protein product [Mytilus coruscus]
MNICNFAKVIISRATKDLSSINAWKEKKENKKNPIYSSHISLQDRFQNYEIFIDQYPKMTMNFKDFSLKYKRLQGYITDKKYWNNNNKEGQQNKFLEYFSFKNWQKLPEPEKKQHTLENCRLCNTVHIEHSSLHKSAAPEVTKLTALCQSVTNTIIRQSTPSSSHGTTTKGLKAVQNIVKIVQPMMEKNLNIKFENPIKVSISPLKTPEQKRKEFERNLIETKQKMDDAFTDAGEDIHVFLA